MFLKGTELNIFIISSWGSLSVKKKQEFFKLPEEVVQNFDFRLLPPFRLLL
jgi:hypothetical protein